MPKLSTIIGHEKVIARLQTSMANGSIGHAYLFAGPAGVGKTTVARAFGKALNCEKSAALIGGPADACEICAPCRQADAGVHPDIHMVRPAMLGTEAEGGERQASSEIRISQIREMNSKLHLTPSIGRRKVFIITPAEAMNEQAQNALLKSLEEPPAFSTVILCAESAESLLPTIRSRCGVLQFGLAPRRIIQLRLRELFGLSPEEAAVLASLSQGKVGVAIRYTSEPSLRQARTRLLDLLIESMSGSPLKALQSAGPLREMASKIPILVNTLSGTGTQAVGERVSNRLQLQILLEELAVLVRDILVLRLAQAEGNQEPEDRLVNIDRKSALLALAQTRPEPQLRKALEAVLTAQNLLSRNVSTQLLLEDLLLELSS